MFRAKNWSRFFSVFGFAWAAVVVLCCLGSKDALAQNIDWQNEFDRCYALDWYYESQSTLRLEPLSERSSLLWYCQAKPRSAPQFLNRQYQSYQEEWLDALDFSLLRCERGEAEDCTYRCALAPSVCAPHFWP